MKALRRGLVIVKFIKEATDSILYSEHPIKIGSHTSRGGGGVAGLLPNITGMCAPGFELNLF